MAKIAATVLDAADIRALDCLLPDDAPASALAARLAQIAHLPLAGPDDYALHYGLVVKGGRAIDPHSALDALRIREPFAARLVPEIVASAEEADADCLDEAAEAASPDEAEPLAIEVIEQRSLLHDAGLELPCDVMIAAAVHREIAAFAGEDRQTECAGLLLGEVGAGERTRVIHITAVAPAVEAAGSRTSVKIGLDAWESMLAIRDDDYSDLRILGWFHTHAGWGVFMSDADLFIHRHFFGHPNMVAYVLDPTTGRDGFFHWHDGKIGMCGSYGLVGTSGPASARKRRGKGKRARRPDLRDCAILGLAGAGIWLAIARPFVAQHTPSRTRSPQHSRAAAPRHSGPVSKSSGRVHALGRGENLWLVCQRVYGDGGLAAALARYNGLADCTHLHAGQPIKLPAKKVLQAMAR